MLLQINRSLVIFIFISGFILTSCYKKPEGCRDYRALNYDVKADKECENDCCTYPELELTSSFEYDGQIIDTSTYFQHGSLEDLKISSLVFYLSEFNLTGGIKNSSSISDEQVSIGIQESGSLIYQLFDFSVAKIKLSSSNAYKLGEFRNADIYSGLSVNFGIKSDINHGDLSKINTSNPLYQSQDSMYINADEGFHFLKLVLEYNGNQKRSIEIYGDENFTEFINTGIFDFRERETRNINLQISLSTWFEGIDFENESNEVVTSKLKNQLKNALFFNN